MAAGAVLMISGYAVLTGLIILFLKFGIFSFIKRKEWAILCDDGIGE